MPSRTKIEHEVLSPERSEEVQQLLQALSDVGQVTVSLSPELAQIVVKFLSSALETGAVAFAAVSPEITPEEAAKIFDNDCPET